MLDFVKSLRILELNKTSEFPITKEFRISYTGKPPQQCPLLCLQNTTITKTKQLLETSRQPIFRALFQRASNVFLKSLHCTCCKVRIFRRQSPRPTSTKLPDLRPARPAARPARSSSEPRQAPTSQPPPPRGAGCPSLWPDAGDCGRRQQRTPRSPSRSPRLRRRGHPHSNTASVRGARTSRRCSENPGARNRLLAAPLGAARRTRRASTRGPGDDGAGKSRGPALPWPRIAGFRTETPPLAAAVLAAAGRAPPPTRPGPGAGPCGSGFRAPCGGGARSQTPDWGRGRDTGRRGQEPSSEWDGVRPKTLRDRQGRGHNPSHRLCEVWGLGGGGASLRLVVCSVTSHPPDTSLIFL